MRDPSVGKVVQKGWHKGPRSPTLPQIMSNFKHTKIALKSWNKLYFGRIQYKISDLKKLIETLQQLPQSSLIIDQENIAMRELNEILLRERILWKEKAKLKWLEEGDANTYFFSYLYYHPPEVQLHSLSFL